MSWVGLDQIPAGRTEAMRTGQAGERRGTRPSFALGALRPAPHLA
jgi:hypothetical protein